MDLGDRDALFFHPVLESGGISPLGAEIAGPNTGFFRSGSTEPLF